MSPRLRVGPALSPTAFAALLALGTAGCTEKIPTGLESGELFPVAARTLEIRVPYHRFVQSVRVLGGFGSPADVGKGVIAHWHEGSLEARTLVRFPAFPRTASVRDSGGTMRVDSALAFVGGRLVIRIDTAAARAGGSVSVAAGVLAHPWHVRSASWTRAVDTIGGTVAWEEPGAGPVEPMGTGTWTPGAGDSVSIAVDSATLAVLGDTARPERSVRIDLETEGARLEILSATLRLSARPSVRKDTILTLTVASQDLTFLYDPPPAPPDGELRVGGAPAWRSVLVLDPPREFRAGDLVCERIPCPVVLDSANLTYAALVLRTRRAPPGFRPASSVPLELRPVLSPERLPKAPLSAPVDAPPPAVSASAFGPGGEVEVAVPVTRFLRDHLRGKTFEGDPPSNTIALLVGGREPQGFGIASFAATGEGAPELRLVVTVAERIGLP